MFKMFKELCAKEVKFIKDAEYLILGDVKTGEDKDKYHIACKRGDELPAPVYLIKEEKKDAKG